MFWPLNWTWFMEEGAKISRVVVLVQSPVRERVECEILVVRTKYGPWTMTKIV
jgi:hypothetical protein